MGRHALRRPAIHPAGLVGGDPPRPRDLRHGARLQPDGRRDPRCPRPQAEALTMALLEIENLSVEFPTQGGTMRAVEGVSLRLDEGELLGVVGESGSGKSVSMLAVMGLLPPTARVTADRMTFQGKDLLTLSTAARRRLVGNDVSMIFQEPTTSLNPCFTIGFQIDETLKVHTPG